MIGNDLVKRKYELALYSLGQKQKSFRARLHSISYSVTTIKRVSSSSVATYEALPMINYIYPHLAIRLHNPSSYSVSSVLHSSLFNHNKT